MQRVPTAQAVEVEAEALVGALLAEEVEPPRAVEAPLEQPNKTVQVKPGVGPADGTPVATELLPREARGADQPGEGAAGELAQRDARHGVEQAKQFMDLVPGVEIGRASGRGKE